MAIDILSFQRALPVDRDRLQRHTRLAMEALGQQGARVSLVLVNDRRMRALNRSYRGKSATTDVLSFDGPSGLPPGEARYLGEIVISVPRAYRQAATEGIAPDDEISNLMIHGLCHLLGYDHERGAKERRLMKETERRAARHILEAEGENGRTITGKIWDEAGETPGERGKKSMAKGER